MSTWYFLDEDCRKDSPKTKHCARCKKTLKEAKRGDSFKPVALHQKHMLFRTLKPLERVAENETEGFIGNDCFKQVQEFGLYDNEMNKIN